MKYNDTPPKYKIIWCDRKTDDLRSVLFAASGLTKGLLAEARKRIPEAKFGKVNIFQFQPAQGFYTGKWVINRTGIKRDSTWITKAGKMLVMPKFSQLPWHKKWSRKEVK